MIAKRKGVKSDEEVAAETLRQYLEKRVALDVRLLASGRRLDDALDHLPPDSEAYRKVEAAQRRLAAAPDLARTSRRQPSV